MLNKFSPKKICLKTTVGDYLLYWREKRGFSQKEVSQSLCLPLHYLVALEKSDYSVLPGEIYVKKFLDKIVSFYSVPAEEKEKIFFYLKKEYSSFQKIFPSPKSKPFFSKFSFSLTPKFFKSFLALSLFFLFFTYLAVEAKNIFQPPYLIVNYPPNNSIVRGYNLELKGKTFPRAEVYINGKKILLGNKGNFAEEIVLHPGVNIIKVKAQKKYSYPKIIYKKVLAVKN